MCPPHSQPTARPDGTKFPPAIFGSTNNSVGNRGVCQGDLPGGVQRERGQMFLPPTAAGTRESRRSHQTTATITGLLTPLTESVCVGVSKDRLINI